KRLEAEGLLARTRSRTDERVVELHLTEKGRALREKAKAVPACIVRASQQTVEQLQSLKQDLIVLRKSLQDAL
ncbi:MAG: MarR family transcriptional regulator, partial [Pseudomonadaceae bacterium]|nr:MarR family transcriptional regulator [Pseudomonadaceae bacterium]